MVRISFFVSFLVEHDLIGLAVNLITNQKLHYRLVQVTLDLVFAIYPLQEPTCQEVLCEFCQDDDGKVKKRAFFEEGKGESVVNALKLVAEIHQHVLGIASNGWAEPIDKVVEHGSR